MSITIGRLEGFARESLRQGRGEWWIVSEMVRRCPEVDETQAREIVARVAPPLVREFIRNRRSFLRIGFMVLMLCVAGLVFYSQIRHFTVYALIGVVIGSFLMAHGWPGLRRFPKGDAPTSIPGSIQSGPVRTGLAWRAGPFERP